MEINYNGYVIILTNNMHGITSFKNNIHRIAQISTLIVKYIFVIGMIIYTLGNSAYEYY